MGVLFLLRPVRILPGVAGGRRPLEHGIRLFGQAEFEGRNGTLRACCYNRYMYGGERGRQREFHASMKADNEVIVSICCTSTKYIHLHGLRSTAGVCESRVHTSVYYKYNKIPMMLSK